jgi:hypothetical protein
MKMLLENFNSNECKEDISKLTTWNESLHEIINNNGVRAVNFAKSKNLTVKSTIFPQRNIHKLSRTTPDGTTPNQIDHILIDRRRHSSIPDVQSFNSLFHLLTLVRSRISSCFLP